MTTNQSNVSGRVQEVVFPGAEWPAASSGSQGLEAGALDRAMSRLRDACGEDGTGQTLVVVNGFIVWRGPDTRNRHQVWSCTKSFLSTCLGLLWDDGLLSPDLPAHEVVPELAAQYPALTLEHLATLTSGYDMKEWPLDPAAPMFPPGSAFHYSPQGDLLAAILTRLAGRALRELFLERIAAPIGVGPESMDWRSLGQDRGLELNGGSGRPEGSVHITAEAMARFGWLFCNRGVWDGRRLISECYLDYATVPRTSTHTRPHDPDAWYINLPGNYGLNWWTNGPRPDGRRHWPHAPERTFAAQGNRNNLCIIIPEWRLVLVRLGEDDIIPVEAYDVVFEALAPMLRGGA